MKFKTKTGVSIPPPTQATIKRRVQEIEQGYFSFVINVKSFNADLSKSVNIQNINKRICMNFIIKRILKNLSLFKFHNNI